MPAITVAPTSTLTIAITLFGSYITAPSQRIPICCGCALEHKNSICCVLIMLKKYVCFALTEQTGKEVENSQNYMTCPTPDSFVS